MMANYARDESERGDADAGRGSGHAGVQAASLGCQADRRRVRRVPQDGYVATCAKGPGRATRGRASRRRWPARRRRGSRGATPAWCGRSWPQTWAHAEPAHSGAACAPLRQKLLAEARATSCGRRAGVVQVIAKLDRLTRNARLLLSVVEGGGEASIAFCDLLTRPAWPASSSSRRWRR